MIRRCCTWRVKAPQHVLLIALVVVLSCGSSCASGYVGVGRDADGGGLVTVTDSRAHAVSDPCAALKRCGECVFDPSDGILSSPLECAWCATTHRCMSINSSQKRSSSGLGVADECPDLRHAILKPSCPDMWCSASQTTNNIYICRPSAIMYIILSSVLVILNVCFYLWLRVVRQLPWKYEPRLTELLSSEAASVHVEECVIWKDHVQEKAEEDVTVAAVEVGDGQSEEQDCSPWNCPICKIKQPLPLGPGHVCFWCNIARLGFLPLFVGISGALLSLVLLLFLSLKPWFSDAFFAYIFFSAYLAYTGFGLHVYLGRASHVHVEAARQTLYIKLALRLRGRRIIDVFPSLVGVATYASSQVTSDCQQQHYHDNQQRESYHICENSSSGNNDDNNNNNNHHHHHHNENGVGGACGVAGGDENCQPQQHGGGALSPASSGLSPEEIRQKMVETAQLLNMDFLDQNFRKVLRQILARDEYALWWEQPDMSSIILYDLWLVVDLTAVVILGVWMFVVSTIEDPKYLLRCLFGRTSLGVIGFLLIFVFTCLLTVTLNNCVRLYILTDRRLLVVFNGVISPTVAETELQSLRYASVYGFKDWCAKPILTFSWEVPVTERRMPPIKSHNFPGVRNLKGFLHYFKIVAPILPPKRDESRKCMRHNRKVWRMYLFICIVVLHLLPMLTLYPLFVPGFLSVILFLIFSVITLAKVRNGVHAQLMTYTPLCLAGNWVEKGGSTNGAGFPHPRRPSQPTLTMKVNSTTSSTGSFCPFETAKSGETSGAHPNP